MGKKGNLLWQSVSFVRRIGLRGNLRLRDNWLIFYLLRHFVGLHRYFQV